MELSLMKTISVRRIYSGKKIEAVINEEYGEKIKELATIFLEELKK